MVTKCATSARLAGTIADARGRRVTPVDPIALYLLHQPGVVDADTLRSIVNEPGIRVTVGQRIALAAGLIGATLVIALFTFEFLTGGLRDAVTAKSAGLMYLCSLPWIVWYGIKRRRFGHIAVTMLRHCRCPHCGYDLRKLPVDDADGATVCPECGCAWRLAGGSFV